MTPLPPWEVMGSEQDAARTPHGTHHARAARVILEEGGFLIAKFFLPIALNTPPTAFGKVAASDFPAGKVFCVTNVLFQQRAK